MAIVVAMASQKGGVGKSTLARALAAVTAEAGIDVGLADLDPRQQTVMRWERARREGGLTPPVHARAFSSLDDALAWQGELDLLILDLPAGAHKGTLAVARHSHLFVQPSGPSVDDLHPAVLLFHELVAASIPKSRLVIALMRTTTKREEDGARAYVEAAGYEALPGSLPERAAYRHAMNEGRTVRETNEAELNERADTLMQALLDRIASEVDTIASQLEERKKG